MGISGFRFDIGFLRAIAVISVLLFHFHVPFFQGGYLGVDIFFVISGYLMTRIILNGFTRENFELKTFYLKRLKRIFPVLLVVSFAILVISIFLFLNRDAAQNAKNVVLSSLFVSNIYYWLYNGYFDPASHENIFLHSWSLSVEWQFYMLYPLLLIPLRRLYLHNRKSFNIIFIAFTMVSLQGCLWITKTDNSFAFYMFPIRAWEMTLGGVAFLFAYRLENLAPILRRLLAFAGYALLFVSLVIVDSSTLWPSIYTLLPVFATFLIIAVNVDNKFLHFKGFQFFGDISYSLYLWHWPVFIVFQYFGLLGNLSVIYMTVISITLSILSYYLVERNSWFSSIKFVAISLPLIVIFGIITYKFPANSFNKFLTLHDSEAYAIGNYADFYNESIREQQFNANGCFITIGDKLDDYNWDDCLQLDVNKKNILLLGDSHAAQFSQSLQEQLPDSIQLLQLNAGIAFPFKNPKGQKESIKLINKFYQEYLPRNNNNIDLIVLSLHWPMHQNPQLNYSKKQLLKAYTNLLHYFKDLGIKVLVIGQQESYTIAYSKIVLLQKLLKKEQDSLFQNRYIDVETNQQMEWVKKHTPSEQLINIYNPKNIQKLDAQDIPYMVDKNHYSKRGADEIIQKIVLPRINEVLRKNK